ncbi:MAG: class I SAM-dependent methyltransferase [Methanoregula sp.]|nr:class I SAM-dependent methyltransferase [Methanoregula sp.]
MIHGMDSLWKSRPDGPSTMAEGIALQRFAESMLPEDIRIFSDPYAIRFLDPVKIAWAKEHPAETQALAAEVERKMPGWSNAIRGRIRYFDDVVQNAPGEEFSQLVILGAGYDTRAYRISTLKGNIRIFEIDRPATQDRKTGIVKKIFGQLPDFVSFIPYEIGQGPWWPALEEAGFSPAKKTLFLLEGLMMYLSRKDVEELVTGIAEHAGAGSAVLFDFVPQSLADGSSDAEGGQEIRKWTIQIGEPIQSGFDEEEVVPFLTSLGYSGVQVIPSRAFAKMYYTGKNANRKVSGLMSLACATIPDPEGHGP